MDVISHKWMVHVIYQLDQARVPMRFRELLRAIKPITQTELTKRLRELERAGLIEREVYPEVPPRVEYALTELGASLVPPLISLTRWSEKHGTQVLENRARPGAGIAGRVTSSLNTP